MTAGRFCRAFWAAALVLALPLAAETPEALFARLLREPTSWEWHALARFDRTLTQREFDARLDDVFDPGHGMRPYLRENRTEVAICGSPEPGARPWVTVRFAASLAARAPIPRMFRTPEEFRREGRERAPGARPLDGLRIAIDPADIGGAWAKMEDRSVAFPGYGVIREGNLNLVVARLLRTRLVQQGASVFLVRNSTTPVLAIDPQRMIAPAERYLARDPQLWAELFRDREPEPQANDPRTLRLAADLLLTKTLETRARALRVRQWDSPDLTIVLQHNATPDSAQGKLTPINRDIFFVQGAYSPSELMDAHQRFRLLTKLFENTTPVEVAVADRVAAAFRRATGFPPVLYGNSANTRLVAGGDPYVVARNLALNREHDGPVVVTEPYFMNQPQTLARLLAGDYSGRRVIAGRLYPSIFREYADCVAEGIVAAYR